MIQRNPSSSARRHPRGYRLEQSELPHPPLPGEVVVAATADDVIDHVAADLVVHAENCVRQFGDFHLALSGGSTFDLLYRRLMYDPNFRRMPWRRTHLWFVEERCVATGDEPSSARQISETIGDHADIPDEQFHPIFAESGDVEEAYEAALREALAWREKGQDRLDYVLLTMGADGRTAGFRPGSPALREAKRLVVRDFGRDGETERVTMTMHLLNAARFIAVLVTGASYAHALQHVNDARISIDDMPIRGIAPINGELKWYLDGPAVGVDVL